MKEPIRNKIVSIIREIDAFDEMERDHLQNTLAWIESGVEIFRIEKPAIPPKHLVCYNVLFDKSKRKLLLFHHRGSGLLLPSGGHVNKNELPRDAAVRELKEELNLNPNFAQGETESPFFLSQVTTVGKFAGHTDVDLWYLHLFDSTMPLDDSTEDFQREFSGYEWLTFAECDKLDCGTETDKHLLRFVEKLKDKF
ncbi:MAG: NUDIX domain-containing protein [Patescibacteria group bacterium]|jgi:8-oxo-dGTP pyrophosphatase MutT (NUDIX family)